MYSLWWESTLLVCPVCWVWCILCLTYYACLSAVRAVWADSLFRMLHSLRVLHMSCMLYMPRFPRVIYAVGATYAACVLYAACTPDATCVQYHVHACHVACSPYTACSAYAFCTPHYARLPKAACAPIFIPTNFDWNFIYSHMVISAPFNITESANT